MAYTLRAVLKSTSDGINNYLLMGRDEAEIMAIKINASWSLSQRCSAGHLSLSRNTWQAISDAQIKALLSFFNIFLTRRHRFNLKPASELQLE